MNKKFDVIAVEDYAVVVDKGASILDSKYTTCKKYNDNSKHILQEIINPLHAQLGENMRKAGGHDVFKIIATIFKRIEGLPLIELPDEDYSIEAAEQFSLKHFQKAFDKHPKGGKMTNDVMTEVIKVAVLTGYKFANKAARSKGVYSEEDMLEFGKFMQTAKSNAYTSLRTAMEKGEDGTDGSVIETKKLFKEIGERTLKQWLKIWRAQKNKLPVAVELEMKWDYFDRHTVDLEGTYTLKITNPETNTIKPVEVYYEK